MIIIAIILTLVVLSIPIFSVILTLSTLSKWIILMAEEQYQKERKRISFYFISGLLSFHYIFFTYILYLIFFDYNTENTVLGIVYIIFSIPFLFLLDSIFNNWTKEKDKNIKGINCTFGNEESESFSAELSIELTDFPEKKDFLVHIFQNISEEIICKLEGNNLIFSLKNYLPSNKESISLLLEKTLFSKISEELFNENKKFLKEKNRSNNNFYDELENKIIIYEFDEIETLEDAQKFISYIFSYQESTLILEGIKKEKEREFLVMFEQLMNQSERNFVSEKKKIRENLVNLKLENMPPGNYQYALLLKEPYEESDVSALPILLELLKEESRIKLETGLIRRGELFYALIRTEEETKDLQEELSFTFKKLEKIVKDKNFKTLKHWQKVKEHKSENFILNENPDFVLKNSLENRILSTANDIENYIAKENLIDIVLNRTEKLKITNISF